MSRLIAPGLHAWAIRRRTHAGFTLVELMIAVCVAAALLGIALPAYQQYRERIRIDQAKQDIMAMSAIIANYQDAHAYPDSLPTSGSATSLDPWGHPYGYLNLGDKKGHGHARKDHRWYRSTPISTSTAWGPTASRPRR